MLRDFKLLLDRLSRGPGGNAALCREGPGNEQTHHGKTYQQDRLAPAMAEPEHYRDALRSLATQHRAVSDPAAYLFEDSSRAC